MRFNINSFRNSYTISDLLKMDLSIYAINTELGMNVSIISKDNLSYEGGSEIKDIH